MSRPCEENLLLIMFKSRSRQWLPIKYMHSDQIQPSVITVTISDSSPKVRLGLYITLSIYTN